MSWEKSLKNSNKKKNQSSQQKDNTITNFKQLILRKKFKILRDKLKEKERNTMKSSKLRALMSAKHSYQNFKKNTISFLITSSQSKLNKRNTKNCYKRTNYWSKESSTWRKLINKSLEKRKTLLMKSKLRVKTYSNTNNTTRNISSTTRQNLINTWKSIQTTNMIKKRERKLKNIINTIVINLYLQSHLQSLFNQTNLYKVLKFKKARPKREESETKENSQLKKLKKRPFSMKISFHNPLIKVMKSIKTKTSN